MKKTVLGISLLILVAFAAPLFAQGPFADVPTDHWAYEAVNSLQDAGIVIGYPDGTYGGKRAMTRYEFAVAIDRMIPIIAQKVVSGEAGVAGDRGPAGPPGPQGPQGPAGTAGITPEQFSALQNLVNEFRDELAALGVDVDTLKRDVAALAGRVDALEKEQRRVKWNGNANLFAIATSHSEGEPWDLDNRPLQLPGPGAGDLVNSISFVRDFDLSITGAVSPSVKVVSDINYGNYISGYLGGVINDYVGTERTLQTRSAGMNFANTDSFFPYTLYAQAGLGKGAVTVGRFPVQLTPYSLKLIDVDSYSVNEKTDSGNYPLDGGMLTCDFGPVGFTGFAVKTDQNSLLGSTGLVSQPTAGLYWAGPFVMSGGHGFGGLAAVEQVAAGQITIKTPLKGSLTGTYMQGAGPVATTSTEGLTTSYDKATLIGANGSWQIGRFPLNAEYAQTKTVGDAGVDDLDFDNKAYDGSIGLGFGKVGLTAGYRQVERNFAGPGYWEKIGLWTNPTNIRGPYASLNFGLSKSLSFSADGAFYKTAKSYYDLPNVIDDEDKVWRAEGNIQLGLSSSNALNFGMQYVRWEPDDWTGEGVVTNSTEKYINIGLAHQFSPNAGLNLTYQIIDYKPGWGSTPYGEERWKGAIAVAQFKAKF